MRFKLEKEDISQNDCNNRTGRRVPAQIRLNNKTTFSLNSASYIITGDDNQRFKILDLNNRESTLDDSFQGLQLKLQKVGNDYKFALVTTSDQPYYYYYDGKNTIIDTIDRIPHGYTNGFYVNTYNRESCSIYYAPLENRKVLIDPKDIISSKNITLTVQDLQNSPNKRLKIEIGDYFFKESQYIYRYYKSANVYDSTGRKVGILNHIFPQFSLARNTFELFPFYEIESLETQDNYFAVKKLGNNYVGCISYENSTCKNFHDFNPNSFGYERDNRPGPYPYYYNLENFDNFLEVDVNIQEHINLETEIELLKRRIERLEHTGVQGPKGEPGVRGVKGDMGYYGLTGPQGDKGDTGSSGAHGSKGDQGPKGEKGNQGTNGITPSINQVVTEFSSNRAHLYTLAAAIMEKDQLNSMGFSERIAHFFGERVKREDSLKALVKGVQGPPGQKGEPGRNGEPGLKGEQGSKGNKGDRGFLGPEGSKGDTGTSGAPGSKGDKGPIGPKGEKGNQGTNGITPSINQVVTEFSSNRTHLNPLAVAIMEKDQLNSMGFSERIAHFFGERVKREDSLKALVKGVQGPPGQKGESGRNGEPGLKGEQGSKGNKGDRGFLGPEGSKGDTGSKGDKGEPGAPGSKGDIGLPGPQGIQGPPGLRGNKGDQGSPGIQGQKGDIGPKGVDGTMGIKGDMGEKGEINCPCHRKSS
ncbi:collagen-like protein [Wolbachia endosymbiont of Drosophila simulans]|uniref:collagen-like protein n=1 Tax=Wolbachia endosymbiont of Drosophila simulans TaxID=77038 RepID=UPI0003A760E0|nr:collagen-like protein [Wolbachia endosymbiont of Drosophila simulans]